MNRLGSVVAIVVILTLSMGFAALNAGQQVTLRLGFTTLYSVSLSSVIFATLILGMVVMLLVGLRSDLKVRRILLERLEQEDRDERARIFVDQAQTSLFDLPSQEPVDEPEPELGPGPAPEPGHHPDPEPLPGSARDPAL